MSIKDTNTTVSFITEKETKDEILRLVEVEKQNGRKMTFSRYVNEVLKDHIAFKDHFEKCVKEHHDIWGKAHD